MATGWQVHESLLRLRGNSMVLQLLTPTYQCWLSNTTEHDPIKKEPKLLCLVDQSVLVFEDLHNLGFRVGRQLDFVADYFFGDA